MKFAAAVAALLFASMSAYALEPKSCDELKAEIEKKLEAKNVKGYTLEIVDASKDAPGKVVGTCQAGAKKIVYERTAAPAPKQ